MQYIKQFLVYFRHYSRHGNVEPVDIPDRNISEDDNVSNDENVNVGDILAEDSDIETVCLHITKSRVEEVSHNEIKFLGCEDLPADIQSLDNRSQFFNSSSTEDMLNNIVFQSNLYSTESRFEKPLALSVTKLQQFIGVTVGGK
ncbi:hypothetical protein Trydic_g11182 [Trypoxylus dichotomus]